MFDTSQQQPSIPHALNDSAQRLGRLLARLRSEPQAEQDLRAIARELLVALEQDSDIVLACIMLNQIAGTYAVRHCIETALLAMLVARSLHKPHAEVLCVGAAALTMNVGMQEQHDSFQDRRGALSEEEMQLVHRHPAAGAELLRCAGIADENWLACVLQHHENDDGSGYPHGCTAEAISQNARLIGLADRYCARVSARNYRRAILPDQALQHLFLEQPQPADPVLSEHFMRVLGAYPPGTLVRLRSGELGVVTRRAATLVHPLTTALGAPLPPDALARALPCATGGMAASAITGAVHETEAGLHFSLRHVWGDAARL